MNTERRNWVVVDESSDREGFCCLAVREELSQRLICDLADEPLEYPQCVERSWEEARIIALAPELVEMLERLLYAAESRNEYKYRDGKLYRETRDEAYDLLKRANGKK